MENLPIYVDLLFIATTVFTFILFYRAIQPGRLVLIALLAWLGVQAFLALNIFYTKWDAVPPRLIFLVGPPLVAIALSFAVPSLRNKVDRLSGKHLTLIHSVRVPVEITLLLLFLNRQIPELMTFEGRNFDIIAGLTAPLVVYYGYQKKVFNRSVLLAWNLISLGLVLNIVIHAILAAPLPFQQLAFDQPNVAIAYYPYVWLPSFIVPAVLFSHFVMIRQLLYRREGTVNIQQKVCLSNS